MRLWTMFTPGAASSFQLSRKVLGTASIPLDKRKMLPLLLAAEVSVL